MSPDRGFPVLSPEVHIPPGAAPPAPGGQMAPSRSVSRPRCRGVEPGAPDPVEGPGSNTSAGSLSGLPARVSNSLSGGDF